jgi:hypothetical protein
LSCHCSIAITTALVIIAGFIVVEFIIVAIVVERNCSTSSSVKFVSIIIVVAVERGARLPLGSVRLSAFGFVAGSACFDLEFRSGEYGRVEILDSERMRDHERCRHRV